MSLHDHKPQASIDAATLSPAPPPLQSPKASGQHLDVDALPSSSAAHTTAAASEQMDRHSVMSPVPASPAATHHPAAPSSQGTSTADLSGVLVVAFILILSLAALCRKWLRRRRAIPAAKLPQELREAPQPSSPFSFSVSVNHSDTSPIEEPVIVQEAPAGADLTDLLQRPSPLPTSASISAPAPAPQPVSAQAPIPAVPEEITPSHDSLLVSIEPPASAALPPPAPPGSEELLSRLLELLDLHDQLRHCHSAADRDIIFKSQRPYLHPYFAWRLESPGEPGELLESLIRENHGEIILGHEWDESRMRAVGRPPSHPPPYRCRHSSRAGLILQGELIRKQDIELE